MSSNAIHVAGVEGLIQRLVTYRRLNPTRTDGAYTVEVLPSDTLSGALNAEGFFPPECSRLVIEFYPDSVMRLRFDTFATMQQAEVLDRVLGDVLGEGA